MLLRCGGSSSYTDLCPILLPWIWRDNKTVEYDESFRELTTTMGKNASGIGGTVGNGTICITVIKFHI